MASFLENLWTSIFTPGATPTLVNATNFSFLSLQVILFALLVATWSIHFLVLSFLCAGLWVGINWFVRELEEGNRREAEAKKKREGRGGGGGGGGGGDVGEEGSEGDDEEGEGESGVETETEDARAESNVGCGASSLEGGEAKETQTGEGRGGATGIEALRPEDEAELRKRRSIGEASAGDLSTDSEWDKVEEVGDMGR